MPKVTFAAVGKEIVCTRSPGRPIIYTKGGVHPVLEQLEPEAQLSWKTAVKKAGW